MKRLVSLFAVLVLCLSLVVPNGIVSADSNQAGSILNSNDSSFSVVSDFEIDESILNGSEPFSYVQEVPLQSSSNLNETNGEIGIQKTSFDVTLRQLAFGGLKGAWEFNTDTRIITGVSIVMTLQYRENFLHAWQTVDTSTYIYPGGQGGNEYNEKAYYPSEAGTYRTCASGTLTHTGGGAYNVTGCSGAVKYDGKIIISSQPEEDK